MKFSRIGGSTDIPWRRAGGFTFAEILAAMLFVALVIPVAVKGLRLASDAGVLADRKIRAVQLGEAVLNEMVVTEQWQTGAGAGRFPGPWSDYEWELSSRSWEGTEMTELSMRVFFPMRGARDFVQFSTLVYAP